jgi:hypothetical protein
MRSKRGIFIAALILLTIGLSASTAQAAPGAGRPDTRLSTVPASAQTAASASVDGTVFLPKSVIDRYVKYPNGGVDNCRGWMNSNGASPFKVQANLVVWSGGCIVRLWRSYNGGSSWNEVTDSGQVTYGEPQYDSYFYDDSGSRALAHIEVCVDDEDGIWDCKDSPNY